jgi:hypothetical protein
MGVGVPRIPTFQELRLECLKLATVFDPDNGSGDVLRLAKQFADFVIEDKVPEAPETDNDDDLERAIDEAYGRVKKKVANRYGTQAYEEDGNEP